jgi:predicted ATP-grasp superfamily ATP-dependent carboligase
MATSAPSETIRVLVHEWVTGGGLADSPLPTSLAAEGRAMVRAVARDFASLPGVRVTVTLDHRLPDDPGPWEVVRIGPGEEEHRSLDLAVETDHNVLIAPETGGVLERRTRVLERAGVELLGSSSEAVSLTGDKLRLGRHLADRGIATPHCRRVIPADGLPEGFRYPAVLKPIDGAGSVDTFRIPNAAAVPERARAMPEALLQPLVPGVPMSASFLVGLGGCATLIGVGWQSVDLEGARFRYRGGVLPAPRTCFDPDLERSVELVHGMQGFVGVDFLWDEREGRATVLEINPRPTTSVVALVRLLPPGRLARAWLDGEADELAEIVQGQPPVRFLADGKTIPAAQGSVP